MPTSCCPTRPISSATTHQRCSTGRSADADGPGDAIRQPVSSAPDRDVRRVPVGAARSRRAARPARHGRRATAAEISRLCRLHRAATSAARRRACSPAGAARTASATGAARRTRTSCSATSRTAGSGITTSPTTSATTRWRTAATSISPSRWASWPTPEPIVFQLYSRAAAALPPRGARPRRRCCRRNGSRAHRDLLRSAADLVRAARGGRRRGGRLPAARADAAADAHVPFLGLAERVAAADHQPEPAVRASRDGAAPRRRGRRLGLDREPSRRASAGRCGSSTASTRTRSGPGTPSPSGAAPGC